MSSKKISEAEWEVMKVVWESPSSSAAQIVKKLSGRKEWSHRTVKTLLSRLVSKGVLSFKSEGNRYLYKSNVKKEEVIKQESQSFLNRVFDGFTMPMLAHFVKHTKLSKDEIKELKAILAEKEKQGKS